MKRHNLKSVSFSRIALVDKGASLDTKTGDGAHVLLYKRADPADGDTMTPEDIIKAAAALTPEQKASLQKALGAASAPEDILKNADPAVRALVEKAQADAKAAAEESAANKAAIEKLQKSARQAELRKRVDVYASLSGDAEVLGKILGCIEDVEGVETAKKFEEMLKGWNTAIEKGVLSGPIGSRGTTETASAGGATEEVEKLADAIVTKNAGTDKSAAIAQVFEANPALYERYVAENQRPGTAK